MLLLGVFFAIYIALTLFSFNFDRYGTADINDKVTSELQALKASKVIRDWRSKVLGGGRISHDPETKQIKVYGYSQGYGKADHQVSVDILKKTYPDYEINFSDEGY